MITWRHSQAVRQRSAKPLFPSSILGGASIKFVFGILMQRNNVNLIIISGPSGVGKDSVIARMRHLDPSISLSISATTRPPREGEKNGTNYHFLSEEDFKSKIDNNEFLEYATYCGHYYGTLKRPIEKAIRAGRRIILKIDIQGAKRVRETHGENLLSVFVSPPSVNSLKERIMLRNLDSDDSVSLRLERAKNEIKYSSEYDFVVVNDVVDFCARKILGKIYGVEEFE